MILDYKNLSPREFIHRYLAILNIAQPNPKKVLTNSEIELLSEFLLLPPEKFSYMRFSSVARDKVLESFKARNVPQSRQGINNKLYDLIKKDYLRRDEDKVIYLTEKIKLAALQGIERIKNKEEYVISFKFSHTTPKEDEGNR